MAATVTIQSLIEQFTEYKHTVDEDKVQYEERLAQADKFIRQEKAKNARTNQETIANLKTLMLELEMIEKKNQELHDELQQERVDHERTIAQLTEARDAHDDLDQDVQELKRELKQAKDSAAVNHLLSVRSGGSRIGARPGGGGTLRPTRPGANRPDGSSANRFSTLRVDAGFVDLSAEVRALKQQKVELRDQLERESKKLVEVMSLVSQLNIVMGINNSVPTSAPLTARAAAAAAVVAATTSTPTPPTIVTHPAESRDIVKGHDTLRTSPTPTATPTATPTTAPQQQPAVAPAPASAPHKPSPLGSVIYRRGQPTVTPVATHELAPVPSTAELATVRLREAIVKISESEPSMSSGSLSARHQAYVCDDPSYETQLAGVSGRVTALLQVGEAVWVGCGNGQIDVYAADTHARLSSIHARSSAISQLVLAGEYVWLAATDGGVSIFSVGGALVDTLAAHSAKVMGIAAVDKSVWTCGADMTIRVWNNTPPFRCRKEVVLQNLMLSIIYHLGLVWIGTESVISRWNAQTYRRLDTLDRKGKSMHCVNALVSVDETVWSLSGDNVIAVWSAHGEQLRSIELAQRMLGLFSCGTQVWIPSTSAVHVYDASAALVRQIRRPHSDSMRAAVLIATDGRKRVWSGAGDRTVIVWRQPNKSDVVSPEAAQGDTLSRSTALPTSPLVGGGDADSLDTESVLLALKDPVLGLRISTKKIGFGRSKPNAFTARELVDWVLTSMPQIERRHDAVLLARRLHVEGHLQSAQGDETFRDSNRVWQYGAGFRFIMPEAEQKKLVQHSQQQQQQAQQQAQQQVHQQQSTSSLPQTLVRAFSGAGRSSERAAERPQASPERPAAVATTASTSHQTGKRSARKNDTAKPAGKAPPPPPTTTSSAENLKDSSRRKVRKHARRGTVALDSNTVGDSLSRNSSTSSTSSRRIKTTGSQLVRRVSSSGSGAGEPGGDVTQIDVYWGIAREKKQSFAVSRKWTLASMKQAVERVWGVQPTFSLYVTKPNSDEVIGLMTPELNPYETARQLRDEKVDCEWQWRETRSEDWEEDSDENRELHSD